MIFLGDGNAGKSSLIERIIADKFEPGTLPTDGIKVSSWDTTVNEKDFRLRVMDFGGQEIMHSMHRCFLTAHTVYVVVCEIRNDADIDREAARWLENVKAFAPDCPVILALNKADLNSNVSVNERNLHEVNPNLRCVLKTSAKWERERGVADLIYAIQIAVPDCINWFRANADMIGVKRELEQMREDYIDAYQYRTICARNHIDDGKLQSGLLNWFKDLGVAYYYSSKRLNDLMDDVRVLNPAWLTNGIYRLILKTPNGGFLSHETIKDYLQRKDPLSLSPAAWYTPRETEYILYVMRMFEISLEITEGEEMIPMKMDKTPPDLYDEFPKSDALHLRWTSAYFPNNLIHRLMIRKADELDRNCVWRTGGWFHRDLDGCEALAELGERHGAYTLDVYVCAKHDARQYLQEFRAEIQRILGDLNIRGEEVVCCTIEGREGQILYEDVLQQYRDGMEKIYISGIRKYISPAKLLHEHYIRIEEGTGYFMQNNFFDAVKNVVLNEGSGNVTNILNTADLGEVVKAIQGTAKLDPKQFATLKTELLNLANSGDVPAAVKLKMAPLVKMLESADETNADSLLEKAKPFVGDAEKLKATLSMLGEYGGKVLEILKKVFLHA